MYVRRGISLIACLVSVIFSRGQDPHYTQFQAAPLAMNPAYTGFFEGQLRFMANYRSQYGNLVDPFVTSTFALDTKIGGQQGSGESPFNIGVQFMNDRTMQGIFSSNYLSVTAGSHVPMDRDGNKKMGLGLIGTYGSRNIDFNSVVFDAQFASGGFNRGLPTGETVLQNMQPFFSVGAGLLFSALSKNNDQYIEIGASGFNLNKPRQTVLNDDRQYVNPRLAGHLTFKRMLNDDLLLSCRALYQQQSTIRYVTASITAARLISLTGTDMVGGGLWYRTGEGVAPYIFFDYGKMQIGFSYDVASNKFRKGANPARSFEMSFQLRLSRLVDRMSCIRLAP